MNSFIAFFMLIGQLFAAFFGLFNGNATIKDAADFVPVLRFEVISDTHINTLGDSHCRRLQKSLEISYSDAEADENYKTLDALCMVGDITDNGTEYQFQVTSETLATVLKDETAFMGVIHSSHDGRAGKKLAETYLGLVNDFHNVINGYHFIGLSVCDDESTRYNEAQRVWLKQQLDEAVADDPTKPIFVMHHEHPYNTVYGGLEGDSWGVDYFCDIFEQYPQIVHFSGHSHYPLNDPRSIWQGAYTAVGTGSVNYAELEVDGENCIHPDNYKKMGQFWIVEVDKDNRVRLRGIDCLSNEILVEYILENVADVNARQYTPEQRKAASSAPVFSENASLTIKKAVGKYTVKSPLAKSTDGNIIFLYRVYVYSADGTQKSMEYYVNNYWYVNDIDTVSFTVEAEAGDTIAVVAENAYGMQSQPLTYQA